MDDALRESAGKRFDMVLTNPPFGRKVTRNKQLDFVHHVVSLLRVGGSAAVVVPDNVLFEAGAGETIRRRLLHDSDVHTLLRFPTGIFYAQGVKADVLFLDRRKGTAHAWTRELWVYDLRTNKHVTLEQKPLTRADWEDFVASYNPDNLHARLEDLKRRNLDWSATFVLIDPNALHVKWSTLHALSTFKNPRSKTKAEMWILLSHTTISRTFFVIGLKRRLGTAGR